MVPKKNEKIKKRKN